MATSLSFSQQVERFEGNEERVDTFVNGDSTTTWTSSGGTVLPSIEKLITDADNEINDAADGILVQSETARDAAITAKNAAEAAEAATVIQAGIASETVQAALIQAGVYDNTTAGLAAVSNGQYFKVKGNGTTIAASEYKKVISPNLFNTATVRDGYAINSGTGTIIALAGSGVSAFIPVTAGQQYILSGTRGRDGVSFFSSASDTAYVAGSYTTGSGPFTAPAGATYMVINLYSSVAPTYTAIQFEPGTVATTYSPYGAITALLISEYPDKKYVDVQAARIDATTVSVPSPNLFNTATIRTNFFLNSATGLPTAATGWGISNFIPVVAGQSYVLSGTRGRQGVSFFTSNTDASLIAGSYDNRTTMPLVVTAPTGATYAIIGLYSNTATTYSNVQFQPGTVPTDYGAFGTNITYVNKAKNYPKLVEAGPQTNINKLVLSATGTSYLQVPLGTDTLTLNLLPFKANTHNQSLVFNFSQDQINGVAFRPSEDDVAPYRVFNATIGANHGYAKTDCTVTAHGKTLVDVGSVWTDGTNQWVIVDIPSVNVISISARTSNNNFASGTLTHVSGATHTTSFTPASVVANQWYTPIKNRKFSISVDGITITDYENTYPYMDNVTFSESYEIMNKSSIVEWLITQVGTATNIPFYTGGTSDLSVSMSYVFDTNGGCVGYQDFLALNNVTNFQDIMFTQVYGMWTNTFTGLGAPKYYVPKTLPLTHESVNYNFTIPTDMTGFAPTTRLDFTPSRCEPTGQLADRAMMINDKVGIAFGYLPVRDADPAVRRTNATRKALQISEIAKVYPSCIDTTSKTSLTAGDYFSAITYRNWFIKNTSRTASYVVRSHEGDYLYCDWHINTVDRIELPPDLQGKAYTLFEKSSNVTIMSKNTGSSIVFNAQAAGSYGYAILKFNK